MNGDLEDLAAEYVLGTLDAAERADFERTTCGGTRRRGQAVARWRERLAPLADAH